MISEEVAVQIAKEAIVGKLTPQKDAPIETALIDDQYIVTFVMVLPPGTRGPDFSAQVTIDADSGDVLDILAGAD